MIEANGEAPPESWYAYIGNTSRFNGGIVTYSGSLVNADLQAFATVQQGRLTLWGQGLRGNGTGFGWTHNVWQTDALESLTFSRAGTLFYKKL